MTENKTDDHEWLNSRYKTDGFFSYFLVQRGEAFLFLFNFMIRLLIQIFELILARFECNRLRAIKV